MMALPLFQWLRLVHLKIVYESKVYLLIYFCALHGPSLDMVLSDSACPKSGVLGLWQFISC